MIKIKNFKFHIKNSNTGFTLIEMIVTILVFSMLLVTVIAILTQVLRIQRRATLTQQIQENATYVLESMAKEIRVSNISNQDSPDCTATALNNIIHPVNGDITYRLNGSGNIERQANGLTAVLNSSVTQFSRLRFCITGTGTNDNQSARVTILITLRNRNSVEQINVNLETTVISRDVTTELQNP